MPRSLKLTVATLLLSLLAACAGQARTAALRPAENPNVLWHIVHGLCAPHLAAFGSPLPCTFVHPSAGVALLKDRDGATQFLLIPTARVTGIEDPAVRAPHAPDYFADAWAARGNVEALLDRALPRRDLSLAVNSIEGRTQDQLHIHIDCVRADVRDALAAEARAIGPRWSPFPLPLAGHRYWARFVASRDLRGVNPFILLADGVPGARAAMGRMTLVAVGATDASRRSGFVLLAGRSDLPAGDRGAGEELQDHGCAVGHATQR